MRRQRRVMRIAAGAALFVLGGLGSGCGGMARSEQAQAQPEDDQSVEMQMIEYAEKTRALLEATEKLDEMSQDLNEQRRRLQLLCADHPEHPACDLQSNFARAREAFCNEEDFVRHVDAVVAACHQGTCKQVDDAEIISRTDYMLLTQRLPHTLITFGAAKTQLHEKDKRKVQQFLESLQGERGYVIVVGRASRDGNWKQNLRLAVDRAENTRRVLVEELGFNESRVGYITYGNEKMYLTSLDAERLAGEKMTVKQANRSALIFAYPCYDR